MARLAELNGRIEAVTGARTYRLIRYLSSGGTAAASNLAVLFLLVHVGHLHYLAASVIAFVMSIAVSFSMQKFWTFQDMPIHDVHTQFARYLAVLLVNLALNTILMYLFVEKIGMWYLSAQVLATTVVAVTGYIGYKHIVFRERLPAA